MKQTPKVNEVNEFLEIASDFEDPLELIRESLSNSYDANATRVDITIRSTPKGSDIIIEDDGDGMNHRDLESFFDLGNSRKTDSIGYKGHGTKIFYKSDQIRVNTTKDGTTLNAVMDDPWKKLNNRILPEYEVSESEAPQNRTGTYIRISGFKSGQGFSPEELTYTKIEHYLKWKTIAGSTAHYFDDEHHEMDIVVDLDEEIDDTRERLETDNKFTFPEEQLMPGDGEFPAESMCKVYPPRELEVDYEEGSSTIQIVGMAGGKAARNQLPTYGRHSVQFGIWLAKDHIKVERLNEAISHDNEFIHFMFVANCQDIELAANRGKIRNKASPVYQAIEEEIDHYLSKVTQDPWFQGYLEARRQGELARKAKSHSSTMAERREAVSNRESFNPTNDSEVLLALERSNQDADTQLFVEDYRPGEDIDSIISNGDGSLYNAVVSQTLTGFFKDRIPLQSPELIVCWEMGDTDKLREIERGGYQDFALSIDLNEGRISYGDDADGEINVVEVRSRLQADQLVTSY